MSTPPADSPNVAAMFARTLIHRASAILWKNNLCDRDIKGLERNRFGYARCKLACSRRASRARRLLTEASPSARALRHVAVMLGTLPPKAATGIKKAPRLRHSVVAIPGGGAQAPGKVAPNAINALHLESAMVAAVDLDLPVPERAALIDANEPPLADAAAFAHRQMRPHFQGRDPAFQGVDAARCCADALPNVLPPLPQLDRIPHGRTLSVHACETGAHPLSAERRANLGARRRLRALADGAAQRRHPQISDASGGSPASRCASFGRHQGSVGYSPNAIRSLETIR